MLVSSRLIKIFCNPLRGLSPLPLPDRESLGALLVRVLLLPGSLPVDLCSLLAQRLLDALEPGGKVILWIEMDWIYYSVLVFQWCQSHTLVNKKRRTAGCEKYNATTKDETIRAIDLFDRDDLTC